MANKERTTKPGEKAHAPDSEPVGYKKPPKENQFKKGKSGNPKGRPKKPKSLQQAVYEAVHKPKTVVANGKTMKMAGVDVFATRLVAAAFDLKKSAIAEVLAIVGEAEAAQAVAEAAAAEAAKQEAEKPVFSWTEEREQVYAELQAYMAAQNKEQSNEQ